MIKYPPLAWKNPIELLFLIGLIMVLPLLEAPKNLFWLVFLVTWFINRLRDKNFGGSWDTWDSLITAWILSGYIVALFAGLHHSEWSGANDILRYGSILWLIKRSGYQKLELLWLLASIIVSTFIALSVGLWSLYVSHAHKALELNSVGHVNHSAIYLTISYGALLSALLSFWSRIPFIWRLLGGLLTLLFLTAIFISASRAAVGVALLLTMMLGILWIKRSYYFLLILASIILASTSIAYIAKIEVITKHETDIREKNVLAFRDTIWNSAIVAWRKFPVFGVGMHNFNQISMPKIKQWVEESGKPYVASVYLGMSHGHSLYLNTLAERGLFGLTILLSVLFAWLFWLLRFIPKASDENIAWAVWGGSFSAWFVTVGIGLVNTTLHHEHGILSVLLLGIGLAYRNSIRCIPPDKMLTGVRA